VPTAFIPDAAASKTPGAIAGFADPVKGSQGGVLSMVFAAGRGVATPGHCVLVLTLGALALAVAFYGKMKVPAAVGKAAIVS
jgi:hypothetical protein